MNHGLLTFTNGKPKTQFLTPVLIITRENTSPKWPSKQQPTATVVSLFFSTCHWVIHCRYSPYRLQQLDTFKFCLFCRDTRIMRVKVWAQYVGLFCLRHACVSFILYMSRWPPTAHFFCNANSFFFGTSEVESEEILQFPGRVKVLLCL